MKIGFIGVGNMAKAIIEGILAAENVPASDILIHSAHPANYEQYAQKWGLTACANNNEVAQQADLLFLAVKPLMAGEVLSDIKKTIITAHPVVVSMLSGVSLAELEQFIGTKNVEILRIMPNVNVAINQGITALVGNGSLSSAHLQQAQSLLSDLGQNISLDEQDFSTFVALAGSSPAFVYYYIDSMANAGVKYGLTKNAAVKIAAQAVMGSAANVLQSEKAPRNLMDDVCSPGGTTIAGLLAMEEAGFTRAVIEGIDATIAKDKE